MSINNMLKNKKITNLKKSSIIVLIIASIGLLSLLFQDNKDKECERDNECELSLCDCKCYRVGQTPEALENKICGINCQEIHEVFGCECKNNKCSEIKPIKVAAFNIQIFGKTKRGKDDVMDVLERIAQEFDIMLVQEIRDVKEETAPYYLQKINEAAGYQKYAFQRSERLGRGSSKEAYAYFYNTDEIEFIEGSAYVYNDINDVFQREPYIASFKKGNFDFTLAGIHVKPDDADSEIGHLADVVDSILVKNPNEKDIIVMGDFNADGSYFDEDDNINPFKSSKYHWVITNDMDTMTKTDWTYDRIVMMNATLNYEYMSNSAAVFYFDEEYGINDLELTKDVSDHYPIYAKFRTDLIDDD